MARETKIGLLVGLAFIICFAVILANRSRQELIPHQISTRGGGGDDTSRSVLPSAGRGALDERRNRPGTRMTPAGENSMADGRDSQHRPSNSFSDHRAPMRPLVVKPSGAQSAAVVESDQGNTAVLPSSRGPLERQNRVGDEVPPGIEPGQVLSEPADDRIQLLEQRIAELVESRATLPVVERNEPPVRAERSIPKSELAGHRNPVSGESDELNLRTGPSSTPPATLHRVKAGETLFKIVEQHYGAREARLVTEVFEANRKTLSSPDQLRVGMTLVLPTLASPSDRQKSPANLQRGVASPPKPAADPRVESPRTARADGEGSAPPNQSWYQVRKNDRYVTIAREQLGDASRWREIHELNRDRFPDPSRIREGVRIRLPAPTIARTASRR